MPPPPLSGPTLEAKGYDGLGRAGGVPDLVVLIPESTRKASGGDPDLPPTDGFAGALPFDARRRLEALRAEARRAWTDAPEDAPLLPAYRRFDGNMYRRIPRDAWEACAPGVQVLVVSGLLGLVASRDLVPAYPHSMAESFPPLGRLNRWWRDGGLPRILGAYLDGVRPTEVVDLLSLAYRNAVEGFQEGLSGVRVERVDFPGLGRGSQPRRGETVARILRTGRA